ncbi:1-(5-phosphoribosyl)-5-((5-phosphoribosylamino)methylideneamino)imidazole-4-carboxamide isomerase [Actinomadura logoneensis]|uniref:1-(5-phosphoribosyl)-5-((5-phosphoribosylamino)methylideneamino)imidazole-4-carboxamide isomerase n=1 Tax=Actinomadura logoneensis TaxID=2293572 RepID=A0A372JJ35_9ACTN|nr:1-(5-phosphoribosyl)-5-((5-phosphoribosylamino)methylideneamino)imidazole-4-carboxamide isomerase [Actinomadura logoneensis]RFU39816.1 1-(5-phosphoribosyl)-5-((5-phosphoribosylamino)methylideneamino)imidazole-4-carboxamide isomerase [Actinomadura logoneensis]
MSNFVLMLTRDDVTVTDAHAVLELAIAAGVEHIGFKDVGRPVEEMAELVDTIHAAGRRAHLEVVSLTEQEERASLGLGRELGFDYVLGGTRWRLGADLLADTGIRYFPYVGTVIGHPGTLDGTAEEILADIEAMRGAVAGVNLLAYRHVSGGGDALVREVCAASPLPVLVAGAVASVERIRLVSDAGAWGFTIGAAALDRRVVPGANVSTQLRTVLDAVGRAGAR